MSSAHPPLAVFFIRQALNYTSSSSSSSSSSTSSSTSSSLTPSSSSAKRYLSASVILITSFHIRKVSCFLQCHSREGGNLDLDSHFHGNDKQIHNCGQATLVKCFQVQTFLF